MSIRDLFLTSGGIFVVLTLLIEIVPIKINPWTALFGWIGKSCNKLMLEEMSEMQKELKEIKTEVEVVKKEGRIRDAKTARARILRFADEIYFKQPHSKEHYDQILIDITHYEKYCDENPEFPNQIALQSIQMIKDNYAEHLRNGDFLK